MVKLCICGGGNGAHVLGGTASVQPGVEEVRILTLFADEAERWTNKMTNNEFTLKVHDQKSTKIVKAGKFIVTKDTSKAVSGADIVVLVVPAFAHSGYLDAIKPYVQPGMVIVGLPGQSGFEFLVRGVLGEAAKHVTIMSYESLPWACRILEFGAQAEVLGTKDTMLGAVDVGNPPPKMDANDMMQKTLGKFPQLKTFGHLIGMTLMAPNSYIHPCIMYGQWHNWDGKPLKEKPLFYHGVSEEGADTLVKVSQEIMDTAKAIMAKRPKVDLSNVNSVHDWYKRCYPEDIKDKTSLYTCLRTNAAYNGLVHPCIKKDDGTFMPDFTYRYLTEDIPCGLVVIKAVASLAGVATPNMDKIIMWAQKCMGKEYLINGQMTGKDMPSTRSPQAYGITTLDGMLGL